MFQILLLHSALLLDDHLTHFFFKLKRKKIRMTDEVLRHRIFFCSVYYSRLIFSTALQLSHLFPSTDNFSFSALMDER